MLSVKDFEERFGKDAAYDWPQTDHDGDMNTEVGIFCQVFDGQIYYQVGNPHDGDYEAISESLEETMVVFHQEVERIHSKYCS